MWLPCGMVLPNDGAHGLCWQPGAQEAPKRKTRQEESVICEDGVMAEWVSQAQVILCGLPYAMAQRRGKAVFLLWSLQREGAAQVFERTDREPIAP